MKVKEKELVIDYNPQGQHIFIDGIKSRLTPGKEVLLNLLDQFEREEIGNCYMSDAADEIRENLQEECKKRIDKHQGKERPVQIFNTEYIFFEKKGIDPTLYPNSIDWEVLDLLRWASSSHILLSDLPFIREFLNCPSGQEKEAFKKWHKYWSKVDFASRHDIAPM